MDRHFLGVAIAIAMFGTLACVNGGNNGTLRLKNDITFEAVDGQAVLRITPDGDAVHIEDGAGTELLRLVLEPGRITILNAEKKPIGAVLPPTAEGRGYRVVTDDEAPPIFELRPEPDGDFRVLDGNAALVYRAKLRDYGFKIVDRDGKVRSRVRSKNTKTSLRDRSGVTFMTTRDALSAASAAALALEDLRFAYAVALSVAMVQWEPGAAP